MFYGIDNILYNIYIQFEYEKYFTKYCQSRRILLWFWNNVMHIIQFSFVKLEFIL